MSNAEFAQLLDSSEGLTEQFKSEASKMFESAVDAKVETMLAEQLEQHREAIAEEMANHHAELLEEQIEEQKKVIAESIKGEYLAEMEKMSEKIAELEGEIEEEKEKCEQAEKEHEEKLNEAAAQLASEKLDELTDRLVSYADYIAEQYVESHEQQIEESAKVFLAEGILDSVRSTFAKFGFAPVEAHEHFESKLAEISRERDDAFAQLAEAVEAKFDLEHQIEESKKATALAVISEGMSDAERSKLVELMEGDTGSVEQFSERARILAESLREFGDDALDLGVENIITESVPEEPAEKPVEKKIEESVDPDVAFFLAALEANKSKY